MRIKIKKYSGDHPADGTSKEPVPRAYISPFPSQGIRAGSPAGADPTLLKWKRERD
jgi:hypothetical protein